VGVFLRFSSLYIYLSIALWASCGKGQITH
jgi:hypothetical protein